MLVCIAMDAYEWQRVALRSDRGATRLDEDAGPRVARARYKAFGQVQPVTWRRGCRQ